MCSAKIWRLSAGENRCDILFDNDQFRALPTGLHRYKDRAMQSNAQESKHHANIYSRNICWGVKGIEETEVKALAFSPGGSQT